MVGFNPLDVGDRDPDVSVAKLQNATMATGTAMSAVVQVAQGKQQLELMAPGAAWPHQLILLGCVAEAPKLTEQSRCSRVTAADPAELVEA